MKHRKIDAAVFFGTSAELIKLWPVIEALEARTSVSLLTTNQQPSELRELEKRLGFASIFHLRSPLQGNLTSKLRVLPWLVAVTVKSVWQLRLLKQTSKNNNKDLLVFVHGDTMTCVVGAVAARITRCDVAHIEAGLRSHDWRNPFPEEIDRIITARLAKFHFAPDEVAVKNLEGLGGVVINTGGNTARDSLRIMQSRIKPLQNHSSFTLVSLHRAELLGNEKVLATTINELVNASENSNLVMVIDALTRSTLTVNNLYDKILNSKIEVHEKMAYPDFLEYVIGAERVVTDSGGLQEECGFLGIPCLVHRKATERFDGIGDTARLSMWEVGSIEKFISLDIGQPQNLHQPRKLSDGNSPTNVIIQSLADLDLL
jgi:UDP-N-acetylglucosamine 2-epimerase (non-hydrolysing)